MAYNNMVKDTMTNAVCARFLRKLQLANIFLGATYGALFDCNTSSDFAAWRISLQHTVRALMQSASEVLAVRDYCNPDAHHSFHHQGSIRYQV